jgi:hypothetical protein
MTSKQFIALKNLFDEYQLKLSYKDEYSDPLCQVYIQTAKGDQVPLPKSESQSVLKMRIASLETDLESVEGKMAEIFAAPLV